MTLYNVHIYREMRLFFPGIEAFTPEEAAAKASEMDTADADEITSCDGENLAALVDLVGDEEFEHSAIIDFDHERLRKAAPDLWDALQACLFALDQSEDGFGLSKQAAIKGARAAIVKATAIHQPIIERIMP